MGNRKSLKISYFQFSISSTRSRYENQNTLIGNGKSEIGNSLIGNPWNSGTLEPWNPASIVLNPLTGNLIWFDLIIVSIVLHPLRGKSVKRRAQSVKKWRSSVYSPLNVLPNCFLGTGKSQIKNHNSQLTNTKPQNLRAKPKSKSTIDERKICDSRFLISDFWFFWSWTKTNKISNQKSQFTTHKSQIDFKHPKPWNAATLELWNPGTLERWNLRTRSFSP